MSSNGLFKGGSRPKQRHNTETIFSGDEVEIDDMSTRAPDYR